MRLARRLTLGALLLAAVSACNAGGGGTPVPSKASTGSNAPATVPVSSAASHAPQQSAAGNLPTVKVGSVAFDEAKIVAEIYAQVLENAGYKVDRTGMGLGDRSVVAPAIETGQIDLQPEYIGSRISYEVKQANPSGPVPTGGITGPTGDSATNLTDLQQLLTPKNLTALNYTPAVDTNAFVVRPDTAQQLSLTKMSDTAAVQTQLKWGLATDCPTNPLCGTADGALSQYGITQATIQGATLLSACDTPMADALKNKTIDVGELCSTQADIAVNSWVLLQDDKQTQPADNISPIVRNDFLATVDKTSFEKLLNDVSAKIDTATLTDMNKQVDVDHKDIAAVATQWLKDNGFIQ